MLKPKWQLDKVKRLNECLVFQEKLDLCASEVKKQRGRLRSKLLCIHHSFIKISHSSHISWQILKMSNYWHCSKSYVSEAQAKVEIYSLPSSAFEKLEVLHGYRQISMCPFLHGCCLPGVPAFMQQVPCIMELKNMNKKDENFGKMILQNERSPWLLLIQHHPSDGRIL